MAYTTARQSFGTPYKTAKEVKAAWAAGKDFTIVDMFSPWDGKPINKADAQKAGLTVNIRFDHDRKVCPCK